MNFYRCALRVILPVHDTGCCHASFNALIHRMTACSHCTAPMWVYTLITVPCPCQHTTIMCLIAYHTFTCAGCASVGNYLCVSDGGLTSLWHGCSLLCSHPPSACTLACWFACLLGWCRHCDVWSAAD